MSLTLMSGLLAGAAVVAISGVAAAQEPLVARCDGPFERNATRAEVVKGYGKNAVDQTVGGPEGTKLRATVLYPKDAKRRLEVIWDDAKARRRPSLRITGQSTWATENGVRLGMHLAEIERLNGKPFRLYGFDWDYGGHVSDWQGGDLGKALPGGCTLSLALGIRDHAPMADAEKVLGDSQFLSTHASMQALQPAVFLITLGYAKR